MRPLMLHSLLQTAASMKVDIVMCPYCASRTELVNGQVIYPHRPDLKHKSFYICYPCSAWVGCHPGTTTPLGRLADRDLRMAKQRVHALLDPLWKSKQIKRSSCYARLADHMGIPVQECHVGMFDLDRCRSAETILSGWAGVVPPRCSGLTPRDQPTEHKP